MNKTSLELLEINLGLGSHFLLPPNHWLHVLFHLGLVIATACSAVALGSMIQSLLCRRHIGLLAFPNLQSWLLDRSRIRESQGPGHSRLKPEIHSIQAGRGQLIGLPPRQEGNPWYGSRNGPEKAGHGCICHLLHGFLLGAISLNNLSTFAPFFFSPRGQNRSTRILRPSSLPGVS